MANPGLTKSFDVGGAVAPYRIVTHGNGDRIAVQASAPTDALIGTTDVLGAGADDSRMDVIIGGLPEVEFGGTVVRGDPLTADADGRAVKATVSGSRIIGFAWVSAVAGDIAAYQHSPGVLP